MRAGHGHRDFVSSMLCLAGAFAAAAPARAQLVFANGFDSGTLCAWSNAPSDFEIPGNGLDDDCDGLVDEPPDVCDVGLPSGSVDPMQYAAALDLCRTTTETGPGWGVISGQLTLADGTGTPAAPTHALRSAFGSGNSPRAGASMVVLSTGAAAAPGQTNPSFVAFEPGLNTGTQSAAPADWLAANAGAPPVAPGCPPLAGSTAFDPVLLRLRIRVPDNARSFSLSADFFGADYAEWVCGSYNDLFVALLDSTFGGTPQNPADKNLAFFHAPSGGDFPVGVNLAWANTGLFTQCINGAIGCQSGNPGANVTCTGVAGLTGTGMDDPSPGHCDANSLLGGGTGWLVLRGNVVPGEIIELRLAVWDTSDSNFDSLVLLDGFQWSIDPAVPGTTLN